MKIGKTARGELIEAESFVESEKQANKYYDEAFQKATESLSLGSSSSALSPCASGTRSSGTSSSQPMIPSLGSSLSGTSSSQPMIEVCMDPFLDYKPTVYISLSNKIRSVVESRYSSRW